MPSALRTGQCTALQPHILSAGTLWSTLPSVALKERKFRFISTGDNDLSLSWLDEGWSFAKAKLSLQELREQYYCKN